MCLEDRWMWAPVAADYSQVFSALPALHIVVRYELRLQEQYHPRQIRYMTINIVRAAREDPSAHVCLCPHTPLSPCTALSFPLSLPLSLPRCRLNLLSIYSVQQQSWIVGQYVEREEGLLLLPRGASQLACLEGEKNYHVHCKKRKISLLGEFASTNKCNLMHSN